MQVRHTFELPKREKDEDDEPYGERVEAFVMDQAKDLLAKKDDATDSSEHEIFVTESLIAFAEQQDSNIAFGILFEATQLKLGEYASTRILQAYENEKFVRSAFMHNPTLECIDTVSKRSSFIVTEFLSNPVWLLIWFEKASSQEVSRTISKHFKQNTHFWALMRDSKEKELSENNMPGFATICFSLINCVALSEDEANILLSAFNNPQIPFANLPRVLASAQARIKPPASFIPDEEERKKHTLEAIRAANGCFINVPCLSLTKADFSKLEMNGAIFNQSNLIENNFRNSACNFARFERCTLTGSDFSGADASSAIFTRSILTNVNFVNTNLIGADFSYSELSGVDFSEADFTGAIFTGCKLAEKKNKFISRSVFRMDNVEEAFNKLFDKINNHDFMADLRAAIVHDLIDYCTECIKPHDNAVAGNGDILPPDKAIKILQMAYKNNLFADPRHYKAVVAAVNTVSVLGSRAISLAKFLAGLHQTDDNIIDSTQVETDAQADIRAALENLIAFTKDQVEEGQIQLPPISRRPPPPKHSPAHDPSQQQNYKPV